MPHYYYYYYYNRFTAPGLCPGLPGWAGTRKVKPIWIYCSKRQWEAVASAGPYANLHLAPGRITMPASHHSVFYRPDVHPATQPTASKHWGNTNATWLCDIRLTSFMWMNESTRWTFDHAVHISTAWSNVQRVLSFIHKLQATNVSTEQ